MSTPQISWIETLPTEALARAVRQMIETALLEDLAQGDVTTDNLSRLAQTKKTAKLNVRQDCVISGLDVARQVFELIDDTLEFEAKASNGDRMKAGTCIATVHGTLASILKAERTALNFMQHLCGIATMTRQYVDQLEGTNTRLTHTRKTTPGLRLLEQMAVVHGGGHPHRYNLGSAVMVKDNHLQGVNIAEAVRELRPKISHTMKIEVEADSLEQVREAADAGADIILLDNMSPDQIRVALEIINGRAIAEASGGISLETIADYAATGVDIISTSKITLGVPAIDIGLDI